MIKEDFREKVIHKYLENSNRNCNSIAKELQMHSYTITCVIQHSLKQNRLNKNLVVEE